MPGMTVSGRSRSRMFSKASTYAGSLAIGTRCRWRIQYRPAERALGSAATLTGDSNDSINDRTFLWPSRAPAPVTSTFTMGTAERALLRPMRPDARAWEGDRASLHAALRAACAREDSARGKGKDLYVEEETPVVDIPNVEGQSLVPVHDVPAVDDCPPRHSRKDLVPPALLLRVSLQILRQEWPGPHQAQVAPNDVQELRQFVDARRAKEPAERRQSLLVG